jgi:hypothetical protein
MQKPWPGQKRDRKGKKRSAALVGRRHLLSICKLERRLNLEAPGFQQRLRNILRVLVPPSPLPQSGRTNVLVGGKLELLHNLFERGYRWNNRPNGLGLAPVWISTTLCHIFVSTSVEIYNLHFANDVKITQPSFYSSYDQNAMTGRGPDAPGTCHRGVLLPASPGS